MVQFLLESTWRSHKNPLCDFFILNEIGYNSRVDEPMGRMVVWLENRSPQQESPESLVISDREMELWTPTKDGGSARHVNLEI